MPRASSLDLRERVLAAVEAGASCRQAAERFGIGVATAIRWQPRSRAESVVAAKPMGGDQSSGGIEARAEMILQAGEAELQVHLRELRDSLREEGVSTSTSGLHRFFARHGISHRKGICTPPTLRRGSGEPSRRDEGAPGLVRGAARPRPRADRVPRRNRGGHQHDPTPWPGQARRALPHRAAARTHEATTVTAALRGSGPFAVDPMGGATSGTRLLAYFTHVLVSVLTSGDTVVMDDLSARKVEGVRDAIEAAGAELP